MQRGWERERDYHNIILSVNDAVCPFFDYVSRSKWFFVLNCRVAPFYWHAKPFCSDHLYSMASGDDNIEITRQREHIDQRIAVLVVGISFLFFRILNLLIVKLVEPPPSASKDPRRWRNVFVSWTHAILSGCLGISW